jgi:hypothetical protein
MPPKGPSDRRRGLLLSRLSSSRRGGRATRSESTMREGLVFVRPEKSRRAVHGRRALWASARVVTMNKQDGHIGLGAGALIIENSERAATGVHTNGNVSNLVG